MGYPVQASTFGVGDTSTIYSSVGIWRLYMTDDCVLWKAIQENGRFLSNIVTSSNQQCLRELFWKKSCQTIISWEALLFRAIFLIESVFIPSGIRPLWPSWTHLYFHPTEMKLGRQCLLCTPTRFCEAFKRYQISIACICIWVFNWTAKNIPRDKLCRTSDLS